MAIHISRSPFRGIHIVLIILGIALSLLLVTLGIAVWLQQASSAAALSQSQITQKAVQYVQSTSPGNIASVSVTHTTLGRVGGITCSPIGQVVSSLTYYIGLDPHNLCDRRTPVWLVELHGTFRLPQATATDLQIVLDGKGNFMYSGSGPLSP